MKNQDKRNQSSRLSMLANTVGKKFYTVTKLSPAGYILDYAGNRLDAFSEEGFIPQGIFVEVIRCCGSLGVFVRQIIASPYDKNKNN